MSAHVLSSPSPSDTSNPTTYPTPPTSPSPTPTSSLSPSAILTSTINPIQASISVSFSGTISNFSTGTPGLNISGQNIYDSSGSQVKLYACVIQDGDGNHITQSDIQKIKNMGFNAIRLFFMWRLVQPSATSINTAYFTEASGASPTTGAGVDYVVNWASQLGMYVILCPGWSTTWQPPSWATLLSGGTGVTSGGSSTPINMLYDSQVQAGIYYMYNWMAQHYATNSNVIFESFNEIATTSDSDAPAFAAFNNGWISAIEAGEGANSHLKIVQLLYHWGNSWNYVLSTPYVSENTRQHHASNTQLPICQFSTKYSFAMCPNMVKRYT